MGNYTGRPGARGACAGSTIFVEGKRASPEAAALPRAGRGRAAAASPAEGGSGGAAAAMSAVGSGVGEPRDARLRPARLPAGKVGLGAGDVRGGGGHICCGAVIWGSGEPARGGAGWSARLWRAVPSEGK